MNMKIRHMKENIINKSMIGLFFEDINYGLDGGLHAEMIENRSFEFVEAFGNDKKYGTKFAGEYGWMNYPDKDSSSRIIIASDEPLNSENPNHLVFHAQEKGAAFTNKAYDGICMQAGKKYIVSFFAKADDYEGDFLVSIIKNNEVKAQEIVNKANGSGWEKYETILVAEQEVSYGDFVISLEYKGTVCFDVISMMPEDAVCGLFRRDLVEKLKEIKPGFLRFPGGCVVEGANLSNKYCWKDGAVKKEERKQNWNRWAVHDNSYAAGEKIRYRFYNQTLGIGYYEYFLLCEHLGAKPLPIMNVGLACQFQSEEKVSIDDSSFMDYIQDTLDLIEFANGDVTTTWGKVRIEMGHIESFDLELIGIGNEQWETEEVDFFERYRLFEKAIHALYPDIKLIGSAGPDVNSEKYSAAWDFYYNEIEKNPNFVYAVDEHYYLHPDWFERNTHFYDNYSRKIKVFAGEYAAHCDNGMNRPELNNWKAALSEAAFMTGLERNADLVVLASYAPLFARIGYTQWSPDMIWFDAKESYATPSYYVQKLFGTLKGDYTLQTIVEDEQIHCSVSLLEEKQVVYIKLVNASEVTKTVKIDLDFEVLPKAEIMMMQGEEEAVNSLEHPNNVVPVKKDIIFENNMRYSIPPRSFHVITLKK